MPNLKSINLFQICFGVGAPLFFFGIFIFLIPNHTFVAAALFVSYVWRVYDSFHKTCSRCHFYGTWKCGLPGKIVSFVLQKNYSQLSRSKILQHAIVDWVFLVGVSLLYVWGYGAMGLMASLWPLLAYFVVYKPKRFHGLLWKV